MWNHKITWAPTITLVLERAWSYRPSQTSCFNVDVLIKKVCNRRQYAWKYGDNQSISIKLIFFINSRYENYIISVSSIWNSKYFQSITKKLGRQCLFVSRIPSPLVEHMSRRAEMTLNNEESHWKHVAAAGQMSILRDHRFTNRYHMSCSHNEHETNTNTIARTHVIEKNLKSLTFLFVLATNSFNVTANSR